jgi:hypothetical protein
VGTAVDPHSPSVQGGLIALGLNSLALGVFGLIAALRRHVWASTAFLVMTFIDTALGIFITVILWLSGLSTLIIFSQLPILVLNVYSVLCAASFRAQLKAAAAESESVPSMPPPSDVEEAGGNVLDQTALLCTSDVAEGESHSSDDYPIVIAGRAGGALKYPGVHHRGSRRDNTSDVLLTLLRATGTGATSIGQDQGYSNRPCTAIEA